jgi:DNA-binding GntR family transcriptional regulator
VSKQARPELKIPRIRQVHREPAMAESVAKKLRQGIIAGEFPPGARMRQEELADRLAVSRGPIRQALIMLEREGLVVADRWRGAIVAPLEVPLIKDLYEFRGAVERFVAETLATRSSFDPVPFRELVRAGVATAKSGDVMRLMELDLRFHMRLYEAVGNRVLIDVMVSHWTHTRRVMAATLKLTGYPQTVWDEHAAILAAIESHDPKLAGHRAAGHIAAASERMVDTFTRELERLQAAREAEAAKTTSRGRRSSKSSHTKRALRGRAAAE